MHSTYSKQIFEQTVQLWMRGTSVPVLDLHNMRKSVGEVRPNSSVEWPIYGLCVNKKPLFTVPSCGVQSQFPFQGYFL